MKNFIVCPYCESVNDNGEISQEERVFLICHNCNEEIGEVIPKLDFFYEFSHFIFNFFISLIVFSSIVSFPISTRGFGISFVIGNNLFPKPAPNITATSIFFIQLNFI